MRIGLISDTHGMLRNEVFDTFAGVEHILHAGDVGSAGILVELAAIAPVTAVWGNTDAFDVREQTGPIARLELAGRRIALLHGHQLGPLTPETLRRANPDADIIVYGHTHRSLVDGSRDALVVNPGAAGASRFGIPPSVAILSLGDEVQVDVVELAQ
jgi:uncharacterized protein